MPDSRSTATRSSGCRAVVRHPARLDDHDPGRAIDAAGVAERQGHQTGADQRRVGCTDLLPELVDAHAAVTSPLAGRSSARIVARGLGRGLADDERWREDTDRRPRPRRAAWSSDPPVSVIRSSPSDGPTASTTASAAMAAVGMRIVVRPGTVDFAIGISSNPDDGELVGHLHAAEERAAQDPDREDVRRGDDRGRTRRDRAGARRGRPRHPPVCWRRAEGIPRGSRRVIADTASV